VHEEIVYLLLKVCQMEVQLTERLSGTAASLIAIAVLGHAPTLATRPADDYAYSVSHFHGHYLSGDPRNVDPAS